MRYLVLVALASAAPAAAQPAACPLCARGDQLIDQYSVQVLRTMSDQLVAPLHDSLTTDEYTRIVELRRKTPALARLGAIDDDGLGAIAAALCKSPDGPCVDGTKRTLQCLADRCAVSFPVDKKPIDALSTSECPSTMPSSRRKRSPPLGLGFDLGTGWQRSRFPVDGRTWSLGIHARARIHSRYGFVARIDRSKGRDSLIDESGDGSDDEYTGSVTRISALAGPSISFDHRRFEGAQRFLRLDLLGGYISTRSQPDESGPAAGADLSFQVWALRMGARYVQGFGDAADASMLLVHVGFFGGAAPVIEQKCGQSPPDTSSSHLALGFEFPLFGYGHAPGIGVQAPSYAFEALWHVTNKFDLAARADLLYFPGRDRDRTIHQALLGGFRIDHDPNQDTGFFSTVMAGYTHAAGYTPTAGSGPVTDLSIGWGLNSNEGAIYFRVHSRLGLGDNTAYRAFFFSFGLELRLDPDEWDGGF